MPSPNRRPKVRACCQHSDCMFVSAALRLTVCSLLRSILLRCKHQGGSSSRGCWLFRSCRQKILGSSQVCKTTVQSLCVAAPYDTLLRAPSRKTADVEYSAGRKARQMKSPNPAKKKWVPIDLQCVPSAASASAIPFELPLNEIQGQCTCPIVLRNKRSTHEHKRDSHMSPPYTKTRPHDLLNNRREHIDKTTDRCSQNWLSACWLSTCIIVSAALNLDALRTASASLSSVSMVIVQRVCMSSLFRSPISSKNVFTAPAAIISLRTNSQLHIILACTKKMSTCLCAQTEN